MLSGRGKKLSIAVAILLVGCGTALMFRREDSPSEAAGQRPTAPSVVPKPNIRSISPQPDQLAKFAGRIEPYVDTIAHAETAPEERPAAAAGTSGAVATRPMAAPVESTKPRDSQVARADPSPSAGESPLKWQAFRRPSSQSPTSPPGTSQDEPRQASSRDPLVLQNAVRRHAITDGDSLAALAHRYLGAQERYLDIFEFNRDVLASPDMLPIGKELRIPPPSFVSSAAPAEATPRGPATQSISTVEAARPLQPKAFPFPKSNPTPRADSHTYVVQPHDTLPLIARKLYGDISRQGDLMAANRQQLRSPKDLRPGMTLVVPAARAPAH
jgi:nucleoid-associated protein YgaU